MARGERIKNGRSFSFRMAPEVYTTLSTVAALRDSDVSAVLNEILADAMPALLEEKAAREAELMRARAADLPAALRNADPAALDLARGLLAQLHDLHKELSLRQPHRDERAAA